MTAVLHTEISGELTIFSAAAIKDALLSAFTSAGDIEVDLSQVSEVDSAGLQLLLAARREAATRERSLRFVGHSGAVLDLLALSGLSEQFPNT